MTTKYLSSAINIHKEENKTYLVFSQSESSLKRMPINANKINEIFWITIFLYKKNRSPIWPTYEIPKAMFGSMNPVVRLTQT